MALGITAKCIKYLLFLFNLFFVIIGMVLIGVGVSARTGFKPYVNMVGDTSEFYTPANLFIAVGCIVFFIAFLGCCGAVKENHCMMMTYSVLVGLLLVVELGAAFAAFALQDDAAKFLENGLSKSQHRFEYNTTGKNESDVELTRSWNLMQHTLKCCGTHNFTDWGSILTKQGSNYSIPESCCIEDHEGCTHGFTTHDDPANWELLKKSIHVDGCWEKAVNDVAIQTIGIVGLVVAVVELLGVICACFMARSIRYSYETV